MTTIVEPRPTLIAAVRLEYASRNKRQISDDVYEMRSGVIGIDQHGNGWWQVLRFERKVGAHPEGVAPRRYWWATFVRWERDEAPVPFVVLAEPPGPVEVPEEDPPHA